MPQDLLVFILGSWAIALVAIAFFAIIFFGFLLFNGGLCKAPYVFPTKEDED